MDQVQFWTRKVREAEAELDAATTRTALDAAAKKLQRANAALKALEAEKSKRPKRRASGVSEIDQAEKVVRKRPAGPNHG